VVLHMNNGSKSSEKDVKKMKVLIKGQTLALSEGEERMEISLNLDASKSPKRVVLTILPAKEIAKGIYEDLSPPHRPPFTSGLAPLPVPELSKDEMIAMVRLAALEAIRSGTTVALEDGSDLENYAQSIADTGLRLLLCEKAWDKAKGNIGDPGPFDVDAARRYVLRHFGAAELRDSVLKRGGAESQHRNPLSLVRRAR